MFVDRKLSHPLNEVMAELDADTVPLDREPILAVEVNDKLFVGGGCEGYRDPSDPGGPDETVRYLARHDERARQNVSVCVHGPEVGER